MIAADALSMHRLVAGSSSNHTAVDAEEVNFIFPFHLTHYPLFRNAHSMVSIRSKRIDVVQLIFFKAEVAVNEVKCCHNDVLLLSKL